MKQTTGKLLWTGSFTPFLPNAMPCQKNARRDVEGHECVSSPCITVWKEGRSQERSQGGIESPRHQESLTRKYKEKAKPFAVPALNMYYIHCAGARQKFLWQPWVGGEHGTSLLGQGWAPGPCIRSSQESVDSDLVQRSQPWAEQEGQTYGWF